MKIEILTPERAIQEIEGDEVIIPTLSGVIGVRRGHIPLVSILKPGEVIVKQGNQEMTHLAVSGGFAEILPETVRILADSAERAEEIDEKAVQEAINQARKLQSEATDRQQIVHAAAVIEQNLALLKSARHYHARDRQHTPGQSKEIE